MCFLISLVFLGPRFVLALWWLLNPTAWNLVFDTWLLPVLGIAFLPWTTLMFVFWDRPASPASSGSGWAWPWRPTSPPTREARWVDAAAWAATTED